MMLAYATDYGGESTSTEELHQTLVRITNAGFTHIHWCHEWCADYTYSRPEMLQIRSWMDSLGLKCKGVHSTDGVRRGKTLTRFHYRCPEFTRRDYTSENEYNRQAGVELIRNRIELAKVLGTDAIVLHMQLPYKSFEENQKFKDHYFGQVYKSFDELQDECCRKGIRICLENMTGTPNHHQVDQFDRLFDRYTSDFLGFCFDNGHASITSENCLELAQRYQNRLYMMHLSDNHGLQSDDCWEDGIKMSACDEHLNPFRGNFDWNNFIEIVVNSPYELPIVLEVSKRDNEEYDFLKESVASAKHLTQMILDCRATKNRMEVTL